MNVSSTGSALSAQMQVAVAKKQLDQTKAEGAQTVELIQASAKSPAANAASGKLNIVA